MKEKKKINKSNHSVPNLERALKILELLAKHPEGLNITQTSNLLDIPKNSTFRITSTLQSYGYPHRAGGPALVWTWRSKEASTPS